MKLGQVVTERKRRKMINKFFFIKKRRQILFKNFHDSCYFKNKTKNKKLLLILYIQIIDAKQ